MQHQNWSGFILLKTVCCIVSPHSITFYVVLTHLLNLLSNKNNFDYNSNKQVFKA